MTVDKSPERLARLFVIAVCLSVVALTAWRVGHARALKVEEARASSLNLTRLLADHAQLTLEAADTAVESIVELAGAPGVGRDRIGTLRATMLRRLDLVPQMKSLEVFAPDGNPVVTSGGGEPAQSNADCAYFVHHRTHAGGGLYVGPPIRGADGQWLLTASRRIDTADGGFGGVAVATIDLADFRKFYGSFDIGAHGRIALSHDDGAPLVGAASGFSAAGTPMTRDPAFDSHQWLGATDDTEGPRSGAGWLKNYRRVNAYPLTLLVALSLDDVLAAWRVDAWTAMLIACGVSLALGVMGWRLAGQIRLRHRAETAIGDSERRYRLLADNSTDVIEQLDEDFRRTYVSPASRALLGYEPEALIGQHPQDLVHPAERADFLGMLAMIAATGAAPPLPYRVRRQDGTYVWVEAIGRKLADGGGFIVIKRDIAARKHAEQLLHQANNELQRMVMRDGMTGIANRLCFDATLDKEFRRATRSEQPLALLLLDVDHFKAFNDTYGHPAGDACLKRIAAVIAAQMRRPADLAARYGGEEFAVILPDTELAGAAELADRIRQAVTDLGIPHGASAGGTAAVSVGVAVIRPIAAGDAPEHLVSRADTALYRAKAAGRNRVCVDEPARLPVTSLIGAL